MTHIPTILSIFLLLSSSANAQSREQAHEQGHDGASESFTRLKAEFAASEDRDKATSFAERSLRLADHSTGTAHAVPPLLWALTHAPKPSPLFSKILAGLSHQHATDPSLHRVLDYLVTGAAVNEDDLLKIFDAVIEQSSDRASMSRARFERGRQRILAHPKERETRDLAEVDLKVALSFAKGTAQASIIRRYLELPDNTSPIVIQDDYAEALATAKKEGKLLLVNLSSRVCINCRIFEAKIFPSLWVHRLRSMFIEARLHLDDVNVGVQNEKRAKDLGCGLAVPNYLVVDPKTGKVLRRFAPSPAAFKQPRILENFLSTDHG